MNATLCSPFVLKGRVSIYSNTQHHSLSGTNTLSNLLIFKIHLNQNNFLKMIFSKFIMFLLKSPVCFRGLKNWDKIKLINYKEPHVITSTKEINKGYILTMYS